MTDTPTKKQTLFDLSAEMLELQALLENFDGDVTDDGTEAMIDRLFEAVADNEEEFHRKIDNYLYLAADYDVSAEGLKAESDRLKEIAKRKQEASEADAAKRDRLIGRLEYMLKMLGKNEVNTGKHKLKFGMPGGKQAVEYDLEGWVFEKTKGFQMIPKCYIKIKPELNKDAVREELENGGTLPFARLKEKEEKLKIK